jgi:hypothetical protein
MWVHENGAHHHAQAPCQHQQVAVHFGGAAALGHEDDENIRVGGGAAREVSVRGARAVLQYQSLIVQVAGEGLATPHVADINGGG